MTDAGGKGLGPKIPNVEEDAGSLGLVVGTLVGLDGAKRQGPFFPCPLRGLHQGRVLGCQGRGWR